METHHALKVGTAGWTIPSRYARDFPELGSHLTRYSARFSAVEINSTFRRQHMQRTFEKWAASVPDSFRFSVKFPKRISHELRLIDAEEDVKVFLDQISVFQEKLGPLLLQLPPTLTYDWKTAVAFLKPLQSAQPRIVIEPRHASWFDPEADNLLNDYSISRVAADPAISIRGSRPGGDVNVSYFRLQRRASTIQNMAPTFSLI